jgi:protein-tyrosine phosphatase
MLVERFGDAAPVVSSAGTAGWEGSPAFPRSAEAAAELGIDIGSHVARVLSESMVEDADLVLCMAAEHRSGVMIETNDAGRVFTLKELVRMLERLPPATGADPASLTARIALAGAGPRIAAGSVLDEDVQDPYGESAAAHRVVAVEIQEWTRRLVTGLYGPDDGAQDDA